MVNLLPSRNSLFFKTGVQNTATWNNVGICCFYSGQLDMALKCMQRALNFSQGDEEADLWFNIGNIFSNLADLKTAIMAFKVCISINSNHFKAYNNLAVNQKLCTFFF